jgi:hypothetical protein
MLVPERPREPIAVSWISEEPLSDREALRFVCRELLDQLISLLKPRREGVRQLLCQFKDSSGRPVELVIGLVTASDAAQHLLELLSLQWEHITLPESVACVRLEATSVVSLAVRQRDLFGFETDTDSHREIHTLLDRLTSRLGADAVVRTRLVPDAQPELAVSHEPWVSSERIPHHCSPGPCGLDDSHRRRNPPSHKGSGHNDRSKRWPSGRSRLLRARDR